LTRLVLGSASYTCHCLIRLLDNKIASSIDEISVTTVYFGVPTAGDLEAYLASGESRADSPSTTWAAGSATGSTVIPPNVIGLSLPLLRSMLQRVGLSVAALWAANPVT
jgi:septum formation protein